MKNTDKKMKWHWIIFLLLCGCTSDYSENALRSLPYLAYSKGGNNSTGVIVYTNRSYNGYTLADGSLIDMQGNEVLLIPEYNNTVPRYARIFNNFSYVLYEFANYDGYFVKYDASFNIEWARQLPFHHDIEVDGSLDAYTLSKEKHTYLGRTVIFDKIVKITRDGTVSDFWSSFDNLKEIQRYHDKQPLDFKPSKNMSVLAEDDGSFEYYHINSIQIIPKNRFDNDPRFKEGNIILSLPRVNLIVILEKDTQKIVWAWGKDEIKRQHSPRMLPNGNILIFDNGDNERSYTRVIEINPVDKKIIWEYDFDSFCYEQGYSQELPNGNILITDSINGRVIEISSEKEVLWEWKTPKKNIKNERKTIYRATRYAFEDIKELIEKNRV